MMRLGKVGAFGLAAMWLVTTGCQDPKEAQILGLQDQQSALAQENDSMQSQLKYAYDERDAARAERDAARGRVNELQSLLDECRRRLADNSFEPIQPQTTQQLSNTPQPAMDGVWAESGNVAMVTLSQDILFASGQASLKGSAKSTIRQIASDIQSQYPGRKILVVGHTDTDPIKKTKDKYQDNLDLSLNRGAAVARELYSAGVQQQLVYAAGQGEYNPRESGNSRAAKQANRRVEIIAIGN